MKNNATIDRKMDDAYNLVEKANEHMTRIYMEHVLFTWQWWVALFLCIAPWVLWIIYRKKESTWRLMTSGMFVMLISSWLDSVGSSFDFWHYHYDVLPTIPSYEPWDFTLMPVTIMFLLQFKPNVSPFLKAVIFGILSAFVAEPFFTWIGLYHTENWKFIYSLPIYIVIYLSAHFICTRKDFDDLKKGCHY